MRDWIDGPFIRSRSDHADRPNDTPTGRHEVDAEPRPGASPSSREPTSQTSQWPPRPAGAAWQWLAILLMVGASAWLWHVTNEATHPLVDYSTFYGWVQADR